MANSATQLFDTIPQTDHLNFFSKEKGVDYRNVARFLELETNELSKLGDISKESVRLDTRIPKLLKERLEQIAIICSFVAEYFDGDTQKTALWFKTPNPMLGGVSPRDMIRLGRYDKLYKFIDRAREINEKERP